MDLGTEYIKFGKQKGINLEIGTIKELNKLKEKPDLVIYSHVLEHILNPYEELRRLRKYLKKDSLVYIEVPGVKNLEQSYNQDFLKYLQNAHVYHFSLKTLGNLTKKAGFDLIYGNERINLILRIGKANNHFHSDYKETISFLMNLERRRKNPLNMLRIKSQVFDFLISLSRRTSTFKIGRKIYHSIKRK